MVLFGHSGCSLELCAHGGCWRCWSFLSCVQDSGYGGVPVAGHALWAEVGGGIISVTLGELTGLHKSVPYVDVVMEVIPCLQCHIC